MSQKIRERIKSVGKRASEQWPWVKTSEKATDVLKDLITENPGKTRRWYIGLLSADGNLSRNFWSGKIDDAVIAGYLINMRGRVRDKDIINPVGNIALPTPLQKMPKAPRIPLLIDKVTDCPKCGKKVSLNSPKCLNCGTNLKWDKKFTEQGEK